MSKIATIPLTRENRVHIYQGTSGKYYCIENDNDNDEIKLFPIYYDIHFPLDWVIHQKQTHIYYNGKILLTVPGPQDCDNCKYFGYYNGVFIGYCLNCADELEYKRGNGMTPIGPGVELDETMVAFDLTNYKKENSMWNTYLKDVNLNEIGDEKLYEDYELYKDLPELIEITEKEQEIDEDDDDCIDYESQFDDDDEIINLKI